jgi:hypothetical protein
VVLCLYRTSWLYSCLGWFNRHQSAHEATESDVGLYGLNDVKLDRCLNAAVPKHPSDRFIIAGLVFQPDRRGRMPKLVDGNAQARGLFHALRNLVAEGLGVFASAGLTGE